MPNQTLPPVGAAPTGSSHQAHLGEEALALCSTLNRARFAEEGRRSTDLATYGQSRSNPARIARLIRIWQRAADRWRRRAGYPPSYNLARRTNHALD